MSFKILLCMISIRRFRSACGHNQGEITLSVPISNFRRCFRSSDAQQFYFYGNECLCSLVFVSSLKNKRSPGKDSNIYIFIEGNKYSEAYAELTAKGMILFRNIFLNSSHLTCFPLIDFKYERKVIRFNFFEFEKCFEDFHLHKFIGSINLINSAKHGIRFFFEGLSIFRSKARLWKYS